MSNKPFDLEKALAGEPVRLRTGAKAYVKFVMPKEFDGFYPLIGYFYDYKNKAVETTWTIEGKEHVKSTEILKYDYDIISMWEEPRPRVQLDLPAPLKEPQEGMWFITLLKAERSRYEESDFNSLDNNRLEAGGYFATKEDAEEWINAMRGARR